MIYIALGSNLYDGYKSSEDVLNASLKAMEALGIGVLQASSIWESEPDPPSNQPLYKNAVVSVNTGLAPSDLLSALKNLEKKFGREDSNSKNAARILDLDIVDYGGLISMASSPILPHPRMENRSFVLYPLKEIAENWHHPISKKSIDTLIKAMQKYPQTIKKLSTPLCV